MCTGSFSFSSVIRLETHFVNIYDFLLHNHIVYNLHTSTVFYNDLKYIELFCLYNS